MMRALILIAILVPALAKAQDQPATTDTPQVRVDLDPNGQILVGSPLTVTLTVLVPTYMPQPPVWPDMELADAITRSVSSGNRPVTTRIGEITWAGIDHTYQVTPQRAADYALPAKQITVTYADPTTNAPLTVDVPVPEIDFSAVIPKGAEGLSPFVSAQSLTLSAKVDGLDGGAKPLALGDAITLTVTLAAQGSQAMLLPALLANVPVPEGLHAYPKEPQLTDTPGERGDPDTAQRIEAVTYIVEKPGHYALPSLKLDWWNAANSAVEHAATEEISFDVPAPKGRSDGEQAGGRSWSWLIAILGLAAVVALGIAAISKPLRLWRIRYAESEPALYRKLIKNIRRGPVGSLREELLFWLKAIGSAQVPEGIEHSLTELERGIYGLVPAQKSELAKTRRDLAARVRRQRHLAKTSVAKPSTNALPRINPWQSLQAGGVDRSIF